MVEKTKKTLFEKSNIDSLLPMLACQINSMATNIEQGMVIICLTRK